MTKPVSLQRLVDTIVRLLEGQPIKERVMAPAESIRSQPDDSDDEFIDDDDDDVEGDSLIENDVDDETDDR
jgi:hypothetical protein